ncbi:hydrogenase nickel incorporation protein HypB [Neosynechococcus sphagnicola]|uniref:hydrogenase nickel incorporation protein HypB n=1 Tax=Neosynechococcus sphagnicola TaxID=1501145 RepID=UPI000B339D0E|nr:hydrogenase nickel incorporation protein HypB [Neosynechococcus sphagnicola]
MGSVAINGVIQPDTLHPQFPNHDHPHGDRDQSGHPHGHSHSHGSKHSPEPASNIHVIPIHQGILAKNDRIAAQNRSFFRDRGILVLNLLSSPGAGKTALIERMAGDLPQLCYPPSGTPLKIAVIVGDLATDNDAQRLRHAGAAAVQITTGNTCHLEADMVAQAMQGLDWQGLNLLVIENVGNLVCPASYDLGETLRVVVLSVTEGEDKPLKYPTMFKTADFVLVSKVEVAEAVGCDLALAIANIQRVAPQAQLFEVSARTGVGLDNWYQALLAAMPGAGQPEMEFH